MFSLFIIIAFTVHRLIVLFLFVVLSVLYGSFDVSCFKGKFCETWPIKSGML